jgi:hypothetical protein
MSRRLRGCRRPRLRPVGRRRRSLAGVGQWWHGYRGKVRRWTWWFGLSLGCLLILAGIGETIRLVRSGDGGFFFWFPTLVGGGVLVTAGTLLLPRKPIPGLLLTVVGSLAGILPTMWTLIVPVLLVLLVVASARQARASTEQEATPG